jgi:Helix-turn-helix domain of resolvase
MHRACQGVLLFPGIVVKLVLMGIGGRPGKLRSQRARLVAMMAQGVTVEAIAKRFKVSSRTVYRELGRLRSAWDMESPTKEQERRPSLILSFGTSCKTLAVLSCVDIHPCGACEGAGYLLDMLDFLFRLDQADPVYLVECPECHGSGVGPIPEDSSTCCAVCHRSGKDHWPALRPWPLPSRIDAASNPTIYDPPPGLKGGMQ